MIQVVNIKDGSIIEILSDIGDIEGKPNGWTFDKFQNELNLISDPEVKIKMKSNGGDLFEAFAIYDELKTTKKKVICDIVGNVASSATIISCGCDWVTITENSRYLIHKAQTIAKGNSDDISKTVEELLIEDSRIADVYVKRTGKEKQLIIDLMSKDIWLTAQEALTWGFVDQIIENKSKVLNFKNMEELETMKAEMEALKLELAEAKAKLAEYEMADASAKEAEIEAVIDEAVTDGKIEASAKAHFLNFAKSAGKESIVAMFAGIKIVPKVVDLLKVVDKTITPITAKTKDQIFEDFKSGKMNYAEASKQIKEVK